MLGETADDAAQRRGSAHNARPGVLVVLHNGRPACLALEPGVTVGRENQLFVDDERLSRKHVRIDRLGASFRIRDLGSRNGTFVNGERVDGVELAEANTVVRAGGAIMLLVDDLDAYREGVAVNQLGVAGPRLRNTFELVRAAARDGDNLLVLGESGSGKEAIAKVFHAAIANGPFVAVNCATVPAGLAERLLLGARRGAFSGAIDTDGWLAAAHRGVLFLDEIAELELDVQTKLLRALETGEITPLGATRPQKVDVRFVFATHRDLRAMAASGKFRADLYYRIEQPAVHVPPLRERREEIPWLIQFALEGRRSPQVHPTLIETCMLRPWPGNVRELLRNVRSAASRAATAKAAAVTIDDLEPSAGTPLDSEPEPEPDRASFPDAAAVEETLRKHQGNVSAAARALGLHRNQLRRLIVRYRIDG